MAAVATEAVFDVSKVALNLGSKCVPSLVKAIFTSAKEIRETVRRINNCDEQCVRLSKRIDRLSDVLQKQQFPDTINESIEQALQDFEDFLEKCLVFISKYRKAGVFKRAWNDKEYLAKFKELHDEFNQHTGDITFCINLADKLLDKNRHNDDHQSNSNDIQDPIKVEHNENIKINPPSPLTEQKIDEKEKKTSQESIFDSGIWKYRRGVDEQWQDSYYCNLIFNRDTRALDEQSDIINEETIRLIYDKDRKIFCGMMYPREATTQEAYESSRLFEISIDDPW
ncbi:unnamed protein product [Rotaria sordida]|uniref:Mixed lineage kinase domain-containing protein n=1 Tax=Rotaria sordida TaxID=392033 RepID=A0A815HF44_9BILA|nr:unnamed protein product [Rotaria sordida]